MRGAVGSPRPMAPACGVHPSPRRPRRAFGTSVGPYVLWRPRGFGASWGRVGRTNSRAPTTARSLRREAMLRPRRRARARQRARLACPSPPLFMTCVIASGPGIAASGISGTVSGGSVPPIPLKTRGASASTRFQFPLGSPKPPPRGCLRRRRRARDSRWASAIGSGCPAAGGLRRPSSESLCSLQSAARRPIDPTFHSFHGRINSRWGR